MANQYDSEDFLEKASRSNNKKQKNRGKNKIAEDTRGMQKKINFKRYLNEMLDDEDLADDVEDFDE